jgi:hypothetical protein
MKMLLDDSSFFTTLLRRATGRNAYARGKSHLWHRASIPSGFVEGVPTVEALGLLGSVAGEEVDHWETPSGCDHLEDKRV